MAISLGMSKASWTSSSSNPISYLLTVPSGSKAFVLFIINSTTTAREGGSPTWNGAVLTQAGSAQTGGTEFNVELWYKLNPDIGSYNVSIPNTGTQTLYFYYLGFSSDSSVTYFNIAQTSDTTANPSLTINDVPAGGACAAVLADGYKSAPTGRSHTALVETDQGAFSTDGQYGLIASLSNVTMSWTVAADNWAMIMAAFQEGLAALGAAATQTAKLTEDLAASVAAQTALGPVATQSAKLTEVLGAEVMAAVVEPLEVDDPQQAARVTEDLAVSVSAQPTLEATASQSAKVTEDLATSSPQVVLAPNISESARLTEDLAISVSAQVTLEASNAEAIKATEEWGVSVSVPVVLEVSPIETAKISEDLAVEVGAMLAMEVSTPVETVKATEDLAASVETPVTLEASIADNAKATEESTAAVVGGEVVEDLNVQTISESAHVIDYIAPPLQQSFSTTEVITAEITAQTALAPSVEQSAKVTEDLAAAVATQVALEPSVSDNTKVSENLAATVGTQPTLEASKAETAKATETLEVAVVSPVTIEINAVDTVRATEARTVSVEGLLATLEISVAEVVKTTEATTTSVIAQVALELAAIDSVAVVDTPLVTLPEEGAVTLFNSFVRIPSRYMLAGSFIQITECDEPVDNMNNLTIKE